MTVWVDLPNLDRTCDDDAWVNVGEFKDRAEAEAYLKDNYGIKRSEANPFITEGDEVLVTEDDSRETQRAFRRGLRG